jgi:hypothetical protein
MFFLRDKQNFSTDGASYPAAESVSINAKPRGSTPSRPRKSFAMDARRVPAAFDLGQNMLYPPG